MGVFDDAFDVEGEDVGGWLGLLELLSGWARCRAVQGFLMKCSLLGVKV